MSQKKKLIIILVAMLICMNISFAAFYFFILSPSSQQDEPPQVEASNVVQPESEPEISTSSEEYYSIHFSYNNAVELCLMEARSRNKNLIQLFENDLSSRYKEGDNIYLIKLEGHVGTPVEYDETEHTCEIDPKTQGVTFYKEVTRRKAVRPQG